ncbi:MAG: adenylate cyclase [Acidimicrobiales bacterium]|nr:adenylate cyclase [Acidimicrobiales bacterium]
MSLREKLLARGVPEAEIDEAERTGTLFQLAVERIIVGEPRYTSEEIAEKAETDVEVLRRLWRALGFTDTEQRIFTDADLEAIGWVRRANEDGWADLRVTTQLTRVVGSSLARIADAQVDVLSDRIEELARAGVSQDEADEVLIDLLEEQLPQWAETFAYVHRRHLAAALQRAEAARRGDADHVIHTVGFADLVGFTVLSQALDEAELADVVDRFESLAFDVVGRVGGRVVKMIGDEVMFVADDVAAAAEIALTLSETYANDETLSDVRVGLARGAAIVREGDFFGPAVNLASRLVNIAYPGSVVTDEAVHDTLEGHEGFAWKSMRPRRLKGIGWTAPVVLLRADDAQGRRPASDVARKVRAKRSQLVKRSRRPSALETAADDETPTV